MDFFQQSEFNPRLPRLVVHDSIPDDGASFSDTPSIRPAAQSVAGMVQTIGPIHDRTQQALWRYCADQRQDHIAGYGTCGVAGSDEEITRKSALRISSICTGAGTDHVPWIPGDL